MTDLAGRLQAAVGDGYRVVKELGGGGMSRVFLADEVRLGRKVVIKVLPPEMGAGVNVERFEREIQLAARLQHPHIVPLLTAGAEGDLLYYMMPFIQGESLRAKLAREGELPVSDAVRILKEVADALAYAHGEGVVHRDIKPDNVLLSGRHAVVTDFGVAKAVAASTGESSLTSMGVALGTPAYMSPEQAAANPNVDHRADIYALGALAYEMICGRPPFTGANPQSVLAAHVTQAPDAPSSVRSTIPPALNELILKCLAKLPADRPQRADELIPHLDSLLTPTGGITPTATQPVPSVEAHAAAARAHPLRVGALFALASVGVLAIVYGVIRVIGLPDWVFWAAIALLLMGLPIMLVTGYVERMRALKGTTGVHVTPTGLQRHITWRKALMGGGLAFTALAILTGGYMAMRALGIGPVGTLLASGAITERGRIIVADFINRTSDSTLGPSLTEAFRIDLSQSPVIRVLSADEAGDVLERMQRAAGTPITPQLAREIAEREGLQAVVEGEVGTLGAGYVLAARVIDPARGTELVAVRESASDDQGLIAALDRLSSKLRERIGESYKSLRGTAPLDRVTTASLEALRLYTRGEAALIAGQMERAIDLFGQATEADTAFAMAYRKLAVALNNAGFEPTRAAEAATKAFELRSRLPPAERHLAEGYYYGSVVQDPEQAIRAYRSVLDVAPENSPAANNMATQLLLVGRAREAEDVLLRALVINDSATWQHFSNLTDAQYVQGKRDDARATVDAFDRKFPGHPAASLARAWLAYADGDLSRADSVARAAAAAFASIPAVAQQAEQLSALVSATRGQVNDALSRWERLERVARDRGIARDALVSAANRASYVATLTGDRDRAAAMLDQARARYDLGALPPGDRPYDLLITVLARAGRTGEAARLLAEWVREVPPTFRFRPFTSLVRAEVALARGEHAQVVQAVEEARRGFGCPGCGLYELGMAYDALGRRDSALAAYEQGLDVPDSYRYAWEWGRQPFALKRAGELHEAAGNRDRAIARYSQFVELWANADPELQPIVRDVRSRIARLVAER